VEVTSLSVCSCRLVCVEQKARLLHVGIIVTIQLVIYDFVKQLFGLPATGAH
jgi:hypothetical protein